MEFRKRQSNHNNNDNSKSWQSAGRSRKERLVQARQYGANTATRQRQEGGGVCCIGWRDFLLMLLAFSLPIGLLGYMRKNGKHQDRLVKISESAAEIAKLSQDVLSVDISETAAEIAKLSQNVLSVDIADTAAEIAKMSQDVLSGAMEEAASLQQNAFDVLPSNGQQQHQQEQQPTITNNLRAAIIEEPSPLLTVPPESPADSSFTTTTDLSINTIAYVVPFWDCDKDAKLHLGDAALLLKHSIHLQSSQNNPGSGSGSSFDYKLYALVLEGIDCHTHKLEALGYTVITVASPITPELIEGEYLKRQYTFTRKDGGYSFTQKDGGHLQFLQLLAHQVIPIRHDIVVVLYPNTLLQKPLDDLFYAILHPGSTPKGLAARQKLKLERPLDELPDTIDHFFVRDYPHTGYGRKPVVATPGFWVSRRNPDVATKAFALIHKGEYKEGNDPESGWGSKGYTMYFQGGMTMAGFYAYLLDVHYADTSVELNGCLFNHNGMDNRFRNIPRFHPSLAAAHTGKCRSTEATCDDCTTTDINSIYTILYDETCFAPWDCAGESTDTKGAAFLVDTRITTLDHCLLLQSQWHRLRREIEDLLLETNAESAKEFIETSHGGAYEKDTFQGHCDQTGPKGYLTMDIDYATGRQIPKVLWGESVQIDQQ